MCDNFDAVLTKLWRDINRNILKSLFTCGIQWAYSVLSINSPRCCKDEIDWSEASGYRAHYEHSHKQNKYHHVWVEMDQLLDCHISNYDHSNPHVSHLHPIAAL